MCVTAVTLWSFHVFQQEMDREACLHMSLQGLRKTVVTLGLCRAVRVHPHSEIAHAAALHFCCQQLRSCVAQYCHWNHLHASKKNMQVL